MAYTMVTKNGDMTISSWRRQLRVSFESFDPNFEVTENGGVILQAGRNDGASRPMDLLQGKQSRRRRRVFQDEACDNAADDDHNNGGVAGEESK